MSGCRSRCSDGKFDCSERKCRCAQKLIKDCVCVEWSIPNGRTQTIFQSGGFRRIFASGFVTFDAGLSDSVLVRFFLGNQQIGSSIRVFEESSTAFSFTGFDRITVEYPTTNPGPVIASEGEICIKTRMPVF